MIRIKHKRNPNLKGEKFIDYTFIDLLGDAIIKNRPFRFQQALTYKNIGNEKCEDCSDEDQTNFSINCQCENYLDDYGLKIENFGKDETNIDLINAVKLQLKYLPLRLLLDFRRKLNRTSDKTKINKNDLKNLIEYINSLINNYKK